MAGETGNISQKSGIFEIFSNDYRIPTKQEFCRFLQTGDLEKALEVLREISPSLEIDPLSKIEALVTIAEGYRALAERALSIKPDEELRAYRKLGTHEEIEAELKILEHYRSACPNLTELKARFDRLKKYTEEFETPEEAGAANTKLGEYEAIGKPEELKQLIELQKSLSNTKL